MRGISWLAENRAACQEGPCSVEWISKSVLTLLWGWCFIAKTCTGMLISPEPHQEGNKLIFLSEWREFPSAPCLAGRTTWWQLASRFCWNRDRPWHASELVSFLVGLMTYQHSGTRVPCLRMRCEFTPLACLCCCCLQMVTGTMHRMKSIKNLIRTICSAANNANCACSPGMTMRLICDTDLWLCFQMQDASSTIWR